MDTDRLKRWIVCAGIRAIKTFCQVAVTLIGTDYINIIDVDWVTVVGMSATASVLSLLTSIAGLPEMKEAQNEQDDFPTE